MPIDYFVLMKNRSDVVTKGGNPNTVMLENGGNNKPKRKTSFQSVHSENSAPLVNDTLLKQQKRIELLEDELDALRKILDPKINSEKHMEAK